MSVSQVNGADADLVAGDCGIRERRGREVLMYVVGSSCTICVIRVSFGVKEIAHRPGDG